MHHIQSSTPVYILLSTIENETTSCCKLKVTDTRVHAVQNVLGNVYLSSLTSLTKKLISGTNSVSNLILEVEVHCHKVQGMTEAFTNTLYSHAKTSNQKAVFTAFLERARQQINSLTHISNMYQHVLMSCSCSSSSILATLDWFVHHCFPFPDIVMLILLVTEDNVLFQFIDFRVPHIKY